MRSPGAELLAFGRELDESGAAQVDSSFSDSQAADELLREDPFAFLIGVLFTQGVPAERAWAGPYLLRERLGHLDPARLAEDPGSVRIALQRPPMLHRFKNTLPSWISSAAMIVLAEYEGDAARIWEQGSTFLDVTSRLLEIPGIGRKKAVMATQILSRCFGVHLEGRECGQVAYDVHVRRVFLRSGLVEEDSPRAIEAAAADICPEAPGTLDLAAWLVGRQTCRPRSPLCDECRLGASCPRRVWLGAAGVGARRRASPPGCQPISRRTTPDGSFG